MKRFMLCLLGLLPVVAKAQSAAPGFLQRFEIGYTFVSDKASYTRIYPIETPNVLRVDKTVRDTVIEQRLKTKGAFGVTLGTYVPIAKLGNISTLAFTIHGTYNSLSWDYETDQLSSTPFRTPNTVVTTLKAESVQIGLPLGIEAKFGCDAIPDRSYRFCTSFGVGAMPTIAMTSFNGIDDNVYMVRPFLKAEAGIYTGMCFKLGVLYSFGEYEYLNIDYSADDEFPGAYKNSLLFKGNSTLNISLSIMPFTSTWPRTRWWR